MNEDINEASIADVAHSTARGLINMVPIVGSLGAELFNLVISPPLEKRRAEWMNNIADRLQSLEDSGKLIITDLVNNEEFIDTVIQATTFALRTSESEKLKAFKNAVINTALPNSLDKTKSHIFLNQLNTFTHWHIIILKYLDEPREWFTRINIVPQNYMMGSIGSQMFNAIPELRDNNELLNIIWKDIYSAGFINTSDFNTSMSGDGTLSGRTTSIGKEFLEFIMEH